MPHIREIQSRLGAWYDEHARPLPWRADVSAYHVLLSEIILQQTRVDQGMSYYHRFTERFPSVEDLAAASEDEVLLLWQGLGYYSRGRNLRRAAQLIVSDFGGEIPRTLEELSRLPGVGPYTRGAILSFAYDLPGGRRQCLSGAQPSLRPQRSYRHHDGTAPLLGCGRGSSG